jgi:hypothetical protein
MSLIKTVAELKKYIAIDENTSMATLQPFIDEAEQLYLKDLLGPAFYDELIELYEASVVEESPTPLSDEIAELLPYVQRPLAYYTLLQAIPQMSVTVGELGIRQHRSDKSDSAPRWKEDKLIFNALRNADIHADKLLEFLELKATDDNDYETWFTSTANTKNSGFIVYSTLIASRHIDINNSRRVYLKLRGKMQEIEKRFIPKLIGEEQYNEIIADLVAGDVSADNKALIDLIEPIVSKRALFMQLQFMRVQITENGIFVYSGTDDLYALGQLATDTDIKTLKAQLMDGELGYVADEQRLRQFILDNIADYPEIKATGVYKTQADPGPTFTPRNSPDNKHFIA